MSVKIITFLIALGIGMVPLASSSNNDVNVYIDFEDPDCILHYYEPVKLRCIVEGIDENYFVQWQYFDENAQNGIMPIWENVDCNGEVYEFVLTPENENYYYRVVVMCGDDYLGEVAEDADDLRENSGV